MEDGNTDLDGIRNAINAAKNDPRPSLIKVTTLIGYGSPNKSNSHDVHGAPLGADETAATREALDWKYAPFEVPEAVRPLTNRSNTPSEHVPTLVPCVERAVCLMPDVLSHFLPRPVAHPRRESNFPRCDASSHVDPKP